MEKKFVQKAVMFDSEKSSGKLKIEKLCELIDDHPYRNEIYREFDVEKIKSEIISIDFVDTVFDRVDYFNRKYKRHSILAEIKDINLFEETRLLDGEEENVVVFHFEEYVVVDEIHENLKVIARYDSKSTFLDEYLMTKYANNLSKINEPKLLTYNVQYFKNLAASSDNYNKHRSYRLVEVDGETYLRGITSINKYYEYGIDFAFVVSMLVLHMNMKKNKGIEYRIKSCAINESKLEIIIAEKHSKDAGSFGKVSTAIKVSTNDLGQGSLNFVNIINVGQENKKGFFLLPKNDKFEDNKLTINHTTKPENVFSSLLDMESVLNTSDKFIEELNAVKLIKTPDDLRFKILSKIENPRSSLKGISKLADIFKTKIDNEISSFSKLLEMCNKAEELDIDYDLKDKLRYIISDIMLYGGSSR